MRTRPQENSTIVKLLAAATIVFSVLAFVAWIIAIWSPYPLGERLGLTGVLFFGVAVITGISWWATWMSVEDRW